MEKITQHSSHVRQEQKDSAASKVDANASLQTAKRQFSSLLKKPAQKERALTKKTQRHINHCLNSVQKRLDRDFQTAPVRNTDRHAAAESAAGSDIGEHIGEHKESRRRDSAAATASESAYIAPAASPLMTETSAASQAVQDTHPMTHDVGKIVQQIAERVLVTSPDSKTNPEVRIRLKSSFLDGSSVRVFREGGELKVMFMANTKDAEAFIAQHKGQIEQALSDRLKDERVLISVEMQGGRGAEGEHNEGRSRQRYVEIDDDSEQR